MVVQDILNATVHFVAGKGGVGKTTMAYALAQFCAHRGKTLLVVLSEEPFSEHEPTVASIKAIGTNLFYVKIYPDQTIYEYLLLKIHSQKVLDALMSKSLFRALCAAMPGLSDLTRLGKIWYHADPEHGLKDQIFHHIVVDMPSSGFVGRFLSIPSVVTDAVKVGPIAKEARLMRDYFADARHARLHIVALPEDLIVQETIELYQQVARSSIGLGFLMLNRLLPKHPSIDVVDAHKNLSLVIRSYAKRAQDEALQTARLKDSIPIPLILLNDYGEELLESTLLNLLERELKRAWL